jgi:hypothetical protein
VELIRRQTIGKIKEVHSWSNKKWGDLDPMPDRSDPVPPNLNWDQWLGVAAKRPFISDSYYHPSNWRMRIDFGTSTFGDMGCHIFDPVFGGLELTAPISVRSEGPPPRQHNWAINDEIHYVFPGTVHTEGKIVNVSWYDGDARPPESVMEPLGSVKAPQQGSIFVGTNGVMLLPHLSMPTLLRSNGFAMWRCRNSKPTIIITSSRTRCWVKAKATAAFDYSGPLTEAVLLGPVATRFPQTKLEWNSAGGPLLEFHASRHVSAAQLSRRVECQGAGINGLG